MNRFAFFILLLIFSGKQQMFSQEYLKVLGWNEYTLFPDFYRIRMQKSDSLTNTMLQNGILVNNNQFYKIINFDTIGAEIIYDIKIDTINDLGRIPNKPIYYNLTYIYKNDSYEYQDKLAIEAIRKANSKAEILAGILGRTIETIVNIDDVVEKYLFYPQYKVTSECSKKAIVLIEEYFNPPDDPGKIEFEENARHGIYAIWVTYKLK